MHLPTHILSGWVVASLVPGLTPRERALAMVAATAPDLDGLAILGGREAFETYHHVVGHNLFFALLVTAAVAAWSVHKRTMALLAFGLVHLHGGGVRTVSRDGGARDPAGPHTARDARAIAGPSIGWGGAPPVPGEASGSLSVVVAALSQFLQRALDVYAGHLLPPRQVEIGIVHGLRRVERGLSGCRNRVV